MMQNLINICIVMFALSAILALVITIILSVKNRRYKKPSSRVLAPSGDVSNNLKILNYGASSLEIATAFVALMQCGYITIHKLMNKGNNYNDQMQTDIYNQSLTEKTVIALLDLEAKNGGHLL